VKNTGGRDGDEVVQLYVRDMLSEVTRPVKELIGFARISLAAGESKRVEFTISTDRLAFLNRDKAYVVESASCAS
jgi:beta-glucosidase